MLSHRYVLFVGWDSNSQPQGGVTSWLDEAPFYTIGTTSCAAGQMCGHYTQVGPMCAEIHAGIAN